MRSSRSEFEEEWDQPRESKELSEDILNEPIRRLAPRKPVLLHPHSTVGDAVRGMNERRTGCVLILDGDSLVGIFSERDVLTRIVGRGYNLDQLRLADFMTPSPETLALEDPIAFALNRMSVGGYRHVPLLDESGKVTHIVSVRDVVRFLVEHFRKGVMNLPPSPSVPPSAIPHGIG